MKILGINISHHGSSCLIEDGKVKFFLEDERTSRIKHYCVTENYLGFKTGKVPIYFLEDLLKHTNHIDYIVFSSFEREEEDIHTSDDFIIDQYLSRLEEGGITWGEVVFDSENHHIYHAANGFYGSGFDDAVSLVLDGGGGLYKNEEVMKKVTGGPDYFREVESIYRCNYSDGIQKVWQHYGFNSSSPESTSDVMPDDIFVHEEEKDVLSNSLSCGPLFNRLSYLLGFKDGGDSGKVMGMASYIMDLNDAQLSPYWWDECEWFVEENGVWVTSEDLSDGLADSDFPFDRNNFKTDFYLKCRVAKKLQDETFEHTARLIEKAIDLTGCKNIILSGGYAQNCLNNYRYLDILPEGVKLYVDPIANDSGTALGAAQWLYYKLTKSQEKNPLTTLYLS